MNNPSQLFKVIYKAIAGTNMIFTLGKRNEDFMIGKRNISRPEALSKRDHCSAIADHIKTTGLNIK